MLLLHPERLLGNNPEVTRIARALLEQISDVGIICYHTHVDPSMLADLSFRWSDPTFLIREDHYIHGTLYGTLGIPLPQLGVRKLVSAALPVDGLTVWKNFADHLDVFYGTPMWPWMREILYNPSIFGLETELTPQSAHGIYGELSDRFASDETMRPWPMLDRFGVKWLATTDPATSNLEHHQAINKMVAEGTHPYPSIHIIPTLRPDAAVYNIHLPAWRRSVEDVCGLESHPCDFDSYLLALDARHEYFVKYGAVCTDHSPPALATLPLNDDTHHAAGCRFIEAFDHHGRGVTESDSREFEAYMLRALAGMSARHGLAMQLHPVVARNHNQKVFDEYGPDHGGDMPLPCEFVRNLGPLLEAWGNHEQFKLIISTLDQSCYGQLAALSRGWPAVVTAGPWWWNDRKRGMLTYADEVLGVGGWRNCVGFPDDTRSLPSILARHEVWRRAIALWLSELVSDHQITMEEAGVMMFGLCFGQADAMLTRRTK